jgi:hypothetical protein
MRRFLQIAFGSWFAVAMSMAQACMTPPANAYTYSNPPPTAYAAAAAGSGAPDADAAGVYPAEAGSHAGYTANQSESKALTSYLTEHKLPLVGAQVLRAPDGRRSVVLYGFVGSDFGKSDAVAKTKRYLGDSSVQVDNRISVRPELLSANRSGNASAPPADSAYSGNQPDASGYPGPRSYAEQQNPAVNQYQQFQNQGGGAITSMVPLIALLGVLGMGLAGGGGGFGFGSGPSFGGSPFGYSPYNSYGGGAYPGYPMASPFGMTPYGASPPGVPYTTSPFGSPYGNSPPPFP